MGSRGYYTLELTCDNTSCNTTTANRAAKYCASFSTASCQEAVRKARSAGWKITAGSHTCPYCAARKTPT